MTHGTTTPTELRERARACLRRWRLLRVAYPQQAKDELYNASNLAMLAAEMEGTK